MSKTDSSLFWYIALGIVTVVVIIIVALAASQKKSTELTKYDVGDLEKPKIEFSEDDFDLGKIPYAVYEKKVTIKNTGAKTLEINNVITSCMCTSAKVKIADEISEEFDMHTVSSWLGKIEPGREGELLIKFDPSVHEIHGTVSRTIQINTNDPDRPLATVKFVADVE